MATKFTQELRPTLLEIREAFEDEIATLGGEMPDVYEDETRLMMRAVLPSGRRVRPKDRVRAGVALRVSSDIVYVHPYTMREICTNGAIAAHAHGTGFVSRFFTEPAVASAYDVATVLAELRETVRGCASPRVHSAVIREMRSAATTDADLLLHLMPGLSKLSQDDAARMMRLVLRAWGAGRDPSVFGLMNAVTATARDIRDPELRWDLEELGGRMPALVRVKPKRGSDAMLIGA